MKAIIDLDWLNSEIESENYKMAKSTHELHTRIHHYSRESLIKVRSKCTLVDFFTKSDMINFKQEAPKILEQLNGATDDELFEIWKEQENFKLKK